MQLYVCMFDVLVCMLNVSLKGFICSVLKLGQEVIVKLSVFVDELVYIDNDGKKVFYQGCFEVFVGDGQLGFVKGDKIIEIVVVVKQWMVIKIIFFVIFVLLVVFLGFVSVVFEGIVFVYEDSFLVGMVIKFSDLIGNLFVKNLLLCLEFNVFMVENVMKWQYIQFVFGQFNFVMVD